jgi:protein translocase SecG subunit
MEKYIQLGQIIVSVILIVLILIQQRGTALGSAFGQDGGGGFYSTRRGFQQKLFVTTLILGFAFIALSILNLVF